MRVHDKVKAYAGVGIVFLAILVIVDRATNLDLVPGDIEVLFWASLGPLVAGGLAAYFTREGHGPTK